jgi:tRNA dimethylallyltransferase
MPSNHPLVVIVGPTGSGKSALAIFLARRLDGEVLACDSTQVYRHFDIGTGKVTLAERSLVPHHLMDQAEPDEVFTAGEFRRRAILVLEDLRRRGRLGVLTAGTGLYLRALLEGLFEGPQRSEELRARLRERAARLGSAYLHRILERVDPESGRRIGPRDEPKMIRALEVRFLSGKTISELFRKGRPRLEGFTWVKLGLLPERLALYEKIEQRVEEMLAAGWIEEVRGLLHRGYSTRLKPFQFIGYRELVDALAGKLTRKEAIRLIKRETRHYAKRQITWFRKEPGVHWIQGFGDAADTKQQALEYVQSWLAALRVHPEGFTRKG